MISVIEIPIENEAADDSVSLQPITQKKAFTAAKTFHNFLLQFENTTLELLNAIRKVKNEIYLKLNFIGAFKCNEKSQR